MKRLILTICTLFGCGAFILATAAQMDVMKANPILLGAVIVKLIITAGASIHIINTEDQS